MSTGESEPDRDDAATRGDSGGRPLARARSRGITVPVGRGDDRGPRGRQSTGGGRTGGGDRIGAVHCGAPGAGDAQPLLRRVPQRPRRRGRQRADLPAGDRRGGRRRARRGLGNGGTEAPRPDDAPGRAAAPRRGDLRRRGELAGGRARPRRGRRPEPRTHHRAPPEPAGVRQRHPRSARVGDRPRGPAAAGRRGRGLRQHRRRAVGVADADGALPVRGPAGEPARHRRCRVARPLRHLPRPRPRDPGRPQQRRPSVRHPRRHRGASLLPARRRIQHPGRTAAQLLQTTSAASATPRTSSTSGSTARWSPRSSPAAA